MKPVHPGKVLGLDILIAPSALVGSVVIALVAAAVFATRAGLPAGEALFGGILAMLLYWLSDLLHHFGHAIAARRTGYPMTGVLLHTVLGTSLYPPDEPELPGGIHIPARAGRPGIELRCAHHCFASFALDSCRLQSALECAGVICGSDQSVDFQRRGIVTAGIYRWQYAPPVLEQIAGSRRVMARQCAPHRAGVVPKYRASQVLLR
jgi:hypothetical protein